MCSSIRGAYKTYCALPLDLAPYIATSEQLLGVVPDRDADTCGDEHLATIEIERLLEDRSHPLGSLQGRGRSVGRLDENRELVSAHPRDGEAERKGRPDPRAHGGEQGIAREMSHAVVDGLEVVEVEEENGGVAGADDECVLDTIGEERPVARPSCAFAREPRAPARDRRDARVR